MATEWLPALAKAVADPALLKEIYGDLAKPGVSQVGKALGGILGLGNTVLWPIHLLNERSRVALEANLESYRKKLESVPEANIVTPPAEVGVPIAEKLAYVTDVDLRELYTSLLAKASNSQTQSLAHPSFVNVLNNLSPDEANLLKFFDRHNQVAFCSGRFIDPQKNYWIQVIDLHFSLDSDTPLVFPANKVAYISNLEGLGLVRVLRDVFIVPETIYEPMEAQLKAAFQNVPSPPNLPEFQTQRGKLEVTQFGTLFLQACVKP